MPCGLVEERLQHPFLHMFYNDRSHGSVFCPVLQDLRHRWCWEWLQRPCVPFWNKQETWNPKKSVEDNSRLLSVYLRSWCLDKQFEMSDDNPLIENLSNNKNQYTEVWQNYVSSNKASPIAKQYIQQAVQQCIGSPWQDIEESSDEDSDPDEAMPRPHAGSLEHLHNLLHHMEILVQPRFPYGATNCEK